MSMNRDLSIPMAIDTPLLKPLKLWKWAVIVISVFLMFFSRFLPSVLGLNEIGMSTLGIFIGTMAMLMFINLAWPVVLSIFAFAVVGVYPLNDTIAMSLGHWIFWFVALNGMMIAVVSESGLLRRISIWFISRPYCKKNPWMFVGSLFMANLLLGSVMDVTALIILFTALMSEILGQLGIKKGERFGALMMMGTLIITGVSYGITPIGHVVPVVGLSLFAKTSHVSIFQYSLVGYVVGIVFFIIYMLMLKFVFRLDVNRIKDFDPTTLGKDLGPMTKKEKISAAIFFGIILLWLLPSFIQHAAPSLYGFMENLGVMAPLMLGVVAMCLIRVDGKPLMDFAKEVKAGVPWSACFAVAAAMLLGTAVTNKSAGLTTAIAHVAGPLFGDMSPFVFVILICLFTAVLTNFCSDTVSLTLAASIGLTLINGGVITGVNVGALCIAVSISANVAFATPPGSSYAAIVSGLGWVRVKNQFFEGMVFAILSSLIASVVGYFLASLIL